MLWHLFAVRLVPCRVVSRDVPVGTEISGGGWGGVGWGEELYLSFFSSRALCI